MIRSEAKLRKSLQDFLLDDDLAEQLTMHLASELGIRDDTQQIDWELDLPVKVHVVLKKEGVLTIADLRKRLEQQDPHFMDMRNIGLKSYEKTKDELRRYDEG